MAKTRAFLSFDFDHDHELKGHLLSQAKHPDSPFSINDFSLEESFPDAEWVSRAQHAISECDVVVVLLGRNTHSAPGVFQEVAIARGYGKTIFQLQPQGKSYGKVRGAGPMYSWKWTTISKALERISGGKGRGV